MAMWIWLIASLIVYADAVAEVSHLVQKDASGQIVSMDVIFDMEDKTVMAIIGDVSKYENGVPTVNLHDYNTGYGVLKNINRQTCLLTKTPVPMATAEKYRTGYTTEVHEHLLHSFAIVPTFEEVLKIAGPKIATFCKDYTTISAVVSPTSRTKRAVTEQAARQGEARWCVFSSCRTQGLELENLLTTVKTNQEILRNVLE